MIDLNINSYVEEQDDIDFELDPLTEDIKDRVDDVVQNAQDTWDDLHTPDADKGASINKLTTSVRSTTDYLNNDVLGPVTINNPSVIQRAAKSTLQFPIYISFNVEPPSVAQILCNMIERTYASFVQQAFAMQKIITADQANNLRFLKSYHSNIREAVDFINSDEYKHMLVNEYYEPIDDFDAMMTESLVNDIKLNDRVSVSFRMVPYADPMLALESRRLASDACEGLQVITEADAAGDNGYVRLDSSERRRDVNHTTVKDDEFRQVIIDGNNLPESIKTKPMADVLWNVPFPHGDINKQKEYADKVYDTIPPGAASNRKPDQFTWRNNFIRQWRDVDAAATAYVNQAKAQYINSNGRQGPLVGKGIKYDPDAREFFRVTTKISDVTKRGPYKKDMEDRLQQAAPIPTLLKDNEIKKINQMAPLQMQVTFRVKGDNGALDSIVPYMIGVKGVMHQINATDLDDDLYDIITGHNKALQKVRYKTGEISFMDYMFNASQLRKDAMKNINYNKRWVNNLKRLAELSNLRGSSFKQVVELLNKGDVPIPNATLVLTREDVSRLKDDTGIDLMTLRNARTLLRNLFLISLIVVDPVGTGTLQILYGMNNSDWQTQSMATIETDNNRAMNSEVVRELEKSAKKMIYS